MQFIPRWTVRLLTRSTLLTSDAKPPDNNWEGCGSGINDVLSNRTSTYNGFTEEDIRKYTWLGDIRGLNPKYRNDTFYMTYSGCLAVCPPRTIGYNNTSQGLNIAATWIFPLAILLSLPFEHHILKSLLNWLGSPQTALTASVWNFWQIRRCYQRIRPSPAPGTNTTIFKKAWDFFRGPSAAEINNLSDQDRNRINAFYVLSCFNQHDLGFDTRDGNRAMQRLNLQDWLTTLLYGLFRPLARNRNQDQNPPEKDIIQTTVLLSVLAHELRKNRRRGVFQTLLSLDTFMMAFGFSIVLAFDDLSSSTSIFVLDIGIFYLWVPVIVVFFILDRNPGDSDRQRIYMSRWLYNVDVVRRAAMGTGSLNWWPGGDPEGPNNDPPEPQPGMDEVGEFIGQGRVLSYCGLTDAVIEATRRENVLESWQPEMTNTIPNDIIERLSSPRKRPWAWHIITLLCLTLVWIDVVWAAWADFITPTFGPGCWSLAFIFYGFFSSITWVTQYRPLNPRTRTSRAFRWITTRISYFFNTLAVLYMILMLIIFSGGLLNNCFCNSCMAGFFKGYGGYVDFEGFEYYRKNFNLTNPWIALAASASFVSILYIVTALYWWLEYGRASNG
ncbi:hypothetical protein QBC38DRAFT_499666 [Podospora fimiseda]|uniref:Uncharacterized protein n=1 Tax=Podospora fimiseda TaxID=252190 RepID=A0AAN7GUA0_9PEZI|nr:hypothetical protein QBC38DRAFT_499666 [Podospora fimiseda]